MNANHPHAQMLAVSAFQQMPHVSAWLTQAAGSIPGFTAQPAAHLPVEGYKTSPPLTPQTTNWRGFAFRGSGAQV